MKDDMSAVDILAMTHELSSLAGAYVDKVFHWDSRNVLLRVNAAEGRREVMLQDLKWLFIAPEKPDVPDVPSQFAVNLRKHLTNCRITSVRQREFDRIAVMELERGPLKYQLIIELFSDGNLVLVADGKVVNSVISRKWRHREIRPGVEYVFPQSRFDPRSMTAESFRAAVSSSSSDAVRTLATAVNVGGQYAEEACLRAKVPKDSKAKSLSAEQVDALFDALSGILSEAVSDRSPRLVQKDGAPYDVAPMPLLQYDGCESTSFDTLSAAIYSYLSTRPEAKKEGEDAETKRLRRQLDQQKAAIEAQEAEARGWTEQAEAIYSDYLGTEALLKRLSSLAEGKSWDETSRLMAAEPSVVSSDPKTRSAKAMIVGREVLLDWTLGVEGNANALYGRAKASREKMQGALTALADTEAKLARRVKATEKEAVTSKKEVKKTKEFWFERYKWFVTSGGRMVMAGRDAHSNDQLVKKHLKPGDRFAHADVHGAPSVVISKGDEASDEEMEEACAFALCHSKAWTAGASEGTAYWVLPDQVSKMAQAGEFVPRGAFVIRGKRNYAHHLPLELAVGEVEHEGARKIMCGPPAALEARSSRYVVLVPAKRGEGGRMASRLSKAFNVPEEEVSRILPPGDVKASRSAGVELEQ